MSSIKNFFTKKPTIQSEGGNVAAAPPVALSTRSRANQRTTRSHLGHIHTMDDRNNQRFPTVFMEKENMHPSIQRIYVQKNEQVPPNDSVTFFGPNRYIPTQPRVVTNNYQKPAHESGVGSRHSDLDKIKASNEITTDIGTLIIYQC